MANRNYLNPKNDVVFRRVFGQEKNKDVLMSFVNSVMGSQGITIADIDFLPTIYLPETSDKRVSIVDVLCRDKDSGRTFIIEMQIITTSEFLKRAQYYAARAYTDQRTKSSSYKELKEVVFLAICDGILFKDHNKYISHHQTLEVGSHQRYLNDFSFTFIELGKFDKDIDECKTILDKWLYFFKNAISGEEISDDILSEPQIKQALNELDKFNWSPEELATYDHLRAEQETYINGLEESEQRGRQEGRAEGIQIGEEIGLEKGREEGMQIGEKIGREEGKKEAQMAMAQNLLKAGVSKEIILQTTGLVV